jgi:hypothetical protein
MVVSGTGLRRTGLPRMHWNCSLRPLLPIQGAQRIPWIIRLCRRHVTHPFGYRTSMMPAILFQD